MKTRTVATFSLVSAIGATAILHFYGFKIYGYPTMYRSSPSKDENWRKVTSYEVDAFSLETGEKLSIRPFLLNDEALASSHDDVSERLFNLPFDDLYAKKVGEDWVVRMGDSYLCSHPKFFPERRYGYYETPFMDAIELAELSYPIELRFTGFTSEHELREYFDLKDEEKQNQAAHETPARVPRMAFTVEKIQ